ncbi:hypothetical protein QUF79_15620 [Fictibacillus enclensis]|uniref:hypothetical protein n=1 Tax=Fictibacillus enclensis TaxID=1017270 RepID=UPI0025A128B2|nr:hypothetical protein [Fictibacillus enclensis]MDM5199446.1 hypothetical protein [Fictibacillus enclensis]
MDQKADYILQLKRAYENIKAISEQYGEPYGQALIEADDALRQALYFEFGIRGEQGVLAYMERLH